jgi:hypothetical protein
LGQARVVKFDSIGLQLKAQEPQVAEENCLETEMVDKLALTVNATTATAAKNLGV